MLHWNQIWRHVHGLTGMEIEKRAVMELICYFEEQFERVVLQSIKELQERNRLHTIQGLKQKQRIDRRCVREAIKSINNDGYSFSPGRAGGTIKREAKREKHSQENTEVT